MRHVARTLLPLSLAVPLGAARRAAGQEVPAPQPADTVARLQPVVVTATRDTIQPLASPLPTAVLGAGELRRDHSVSLARTLERLPGVRSLSTGEQIGKPVVRGLSGARVLVLDDGLRLEDYSWSEEDAPSIDARLAQRVEVIRGPASVLYGSDALGGVVNAIPAPLLDARGGPGLRRVRLETYGASNNAELGTVVEAEGARGRLGGRLVVVGRLGQNVHTPAGEIANTGFAAANGEAAVGVHHAGGAESALRVAHYGGEYKLLEVDAPPGGGGEEEGPERITLDDRVQLTHTRRAGALRLEARGQWQRHALAERSDLPSPGPGQPREATVFDLLLNTGTADLLAHHGVPGQAGVSGTVGVSGLVQRNDSRGVVPLVPDATIGSGAAFAFERLSLGRVALLAGARGDVRRLRAEADARLGLAAQSRDYSALTGDVGVVYQALPSLAVAVNAGRAWRAPTLFELFANGPRLGEGRYDFGQPGLGAETSLNLDASVRWESSRVRAEVAAFRNRVHDFVYAAPTDSVQGGLRVYRYDRAEATLVGGEASAAVTPAAPVTVSGRVDVVRGTNTTTDDPLPLIPPLRAALGAEVHPAGLARAGVYVSGDAEFVARQTRLSAAEAAAAVAPGRFPLATGSYTLVDLGAGAARPVLGHRSRLDLRVRNATDRRYRDFLNRYKEFAYDPGVNVVVRLTTEF